MIDSDADPLPPPSSASRRDADRWLNSVLLFSAIAVGLAIRLTVVHQSLWLDELHTSWAASGSFQDVAPRTMQGNQSPPYFYVTWLAVRIFGDHEWALRLPSLIAELLLIASVYVWCWKSTRDSFVSFVAAILIAIDTNFVIFSTEARPYCLVQLFGLAHIALTWRAMKAPTVITRIAIVLVGAVLFYLHYTTVLLFAAELVWVASSRDKSGARRALWQYAVGLALVVIACLPIAPHVLHVFEHRDAWKQIIASRHAWSSIFTELHALRFVAVPWTLLLIYRLMRTRAHEDTAVVRQERWLLICWWLVPVTIAWALTNTDIARLFLMRYMIVAAAAPVILSALLMHQLPKACRIIVGLISIALSLYFGGYYEWLVEHRPPRFARTEDWRGLVAEVNSHQKDHLPVLICSGLIEAERLNAKDNPALREYCRYPVSGMYTIPRNQHHVEPVATHSPTRIPRTKRVPHDVQQLVEKQGGFWLVIRGRPARVNRLASEIFAELQPYDRYWLIEYSESFGELQLIRGQLVDRP